jgi:hypothetical protein
MMRRVRHDPHASNHLFKELTIGPTPITSHDTKDQHTLFTTLDQLKRMKITGMPNCMGESNVADYDSDYSKSSIADDNEAVYAVDDIDMFSRDENADTCSYGDEADIKSVKSDFLYSTTSENGDPFSTTPDIVEQGDVWKEDIVRKPKKKRVVTKRKIETIKLQEIHTDDTW